MTRVEELRRDIRQLERQVQIELRQARRRWDYRIEAGKLRFERNVLRAQRRLRQRIPAYLRTSSPLNLLTAPLIYSLIVPIALLDLWITLYQWACFPIYGIERVRRSSYLVFDRAPLAYLNGIEKLNCVYCSYANGVFAYVREIAARTEQYWCPIRHARRIAGPHSRYDRFLPYGDARAYRTELLSLRAELRHLAKADRARRRIGGSGRREARSAPPADRSLPAPPPRPPG